MSIIANNRLLTRDDVEIGDLYLVPYSDATIETRVYRLEDEKFWYRGQIGTLLGYDAFDNPRGKLVKPTSTGLDFFVGKAQIETLRREQQRAEVTPASQDTQQPPLK